MKFNFFKKHFSLKRTNRILAILLSVDLFFIIAHVLFIFLIFKRVQFNWSISDLFMINVDGGYPEMFQYFKYFVVILITIYLIKKRKRFGYIAWLILFTLLLLDDALQFHETFGTWVSNKLNYSSMLGLRPQDLGELTYVAIFGSILLFFIVFGYMNGDEKYRKRNIDLFLLFGLFLFFGIAMDMVDEFVEYDRYSHLILILLEDGGEMIALSLIVWYFFFLIFNSKNQNVFLFQFLYNKKQSKEESLDEQTKA
jgi:hypothetical protein